MGRSHVVGQVTPAATRAWMDDASTSAHHVEREHRCQPAVAPLLVQG